MQANETWAALLSHASLTAWSASKRMGHAGGYIDGTMRRGSSPRSDTLAALADVCGCDLAIIDRATGERVAVVDPPERGR